MEATHSTCPVKQMKNYCSLWYSYKLNKLLSVLFEMCLWELKSYTNWHNRTQILCIFSGGLF